MANDHQQSRIMRTLPFKKPMGRIFTASECTKIYELLESMDIKSSPGVKVTKRTRGTTLSIDSNGVGSGSGGTGIAVWQ